MSVLPTAKLPFRHASGGVYRAVAALKQSDSLPSGAIEKRLLLFGYLLADLVAHLAES
jgi:hypothetical protein